MQRGGPWKGEENERDFQSSRHAAGAPRVAASARIVGRRLRRPVCRCRARAVAGQRRGVVSIPLDDDALEAPRRLGFRGYAGLPFDARKSDNDRNAIALLRLRLPPSSRSDFGDMLMRFGLPPDWDHTDLSLLAYTGGRSVHDDFSVCETFDGFEAPFNYVFDLVGVGHCRSACEELSPGDALEFERDLKTDHDAVKVVRPGAPDGEATVGYVNSIQAKTVCQWLNDGMIRSTALRFNARPDCPRLFVHAEVFPFRVSC